MRLLSIFFGYLYICYAEFPSLSIIWFSSLVLFVLLLIRRLLLSILNNEKINLNWFEKGGFVVLFMGIFGAFQLFLFLGKDFFFTPPSPMARGVSWFLLFLSLSFVITLTAFLLSRFKKSDKKSLGLIVACSLYLLFGIPLLLFSVHLRGRIISIIMIITASGFYLLFAFLVVTNTLLKAILSKHPKWRRLEDRREKISAILQSIIPFFKLSM
jgi:hypothetical protein